ncbi:MAG: hypothetical protein WBA09_11395, partial [Candidatus Acidiferrum sp.]
LAVLLGSGNRPSPTSRQEVLESLMFARKVTALLKPNSISRFSLLMEQRVIPMLRNQTGFQDVLTFFAPGVDAVTAISLWDSASNAEIYGRATYHEVLKRLAALLEGTPKVDTYEVVNSTFHKIAAAA